MSRRAPIRDQYFERGDVYILHLDPPYKHAAHYSGFGSEASGGAAARVTDHAAGGAAAARLMQVQHEVGGTFRIGRVWRDVTREREVRVKESSAAKYCLSAVASPRSTWTCRPSRVPGGSRTNPIGSGSRIRT